MSSKFLDKTGLDTLWAKIKSTFQTLGNLVTAWGSTPSDTKYPSEKLVKTSLDAKVSSIKKNGSTITPSSGVADIGYMPVAEAQATAVVQEVIQALRVKPGGRMGSVLLSASSVGATAIPTAWYNYIWIPHRDGSTGGDNQNYGTLILTPMTSAPDVYVIEGSSLNTSSPSYRIKRLGNDASFLYANLAWGGAFRNSLSPFDNYAFKSANCFFGAKPSAIRVEYSTDGGTTWVDYGLTDAQKQNLLSQYGTISIYCGHNKHIQPGYTGSIVGTKDLSDENIAGQRLRITICDSSLANEGTTGSTDRWLYCTLRRIGIYMSTQSASAGAHCLFERRTSANFKSGTDTWVSEGDYKIQGDSGWNSIPCHNATAQDGITFGASDSYTREIRFTIWSDKLNASPASSQTGNLCIYKIVAYSELLWNNNSSNPNVGNFGSPYAINSETGVTSFAKGITSGVAIPVSSGGTGKTSVTAGNYLVGNGTSALTEKAPNVAANDLINALTTGEATPTGDDYYVAQYAGGGTTTKTYHRRPVKALWEYIKTQISSVLGLTSSSYGGNAATATTAAGYTSGGAIDTALQGKQADLGMSSSGDAGKFLNEQGEFVVPTASDDVLVMNIGASGSTITDAEYVEITDALSNGKEAILQTDFGNSDVRFRVCFNGSSGIVASRAADNAIQTLTILPASGSHTVTISTAELAPHDDGQSPHDTAKFLRADGSWAAPGTFAYEHTNETNTRNVPTNPRHWFNYRNGDTDTVDSDNLISEYHFGNRGGSEKGVNLVADGLTGRTFTSGNNNVAWCIKCTRLANSGQGHIAVRVMLDRSTDTDDFGFIDIVIKFRAGDWHAYAYPFVRRTQATSFGQVLYTTKNGISYIGIRCSGYSSRVVPIILGDNRNNIFKIEFGEFSSEVSSLTFQPLQTRFPVYADYNDNAMDAIGSTNQPVYVNSTGQITACGVTKDAYRQVAITSSSTLNANNLQESARTRIDYGLASASNYKSLNFPYLGWYQFVTSQHNESNNEYATQLAKGYANGLWFRRKNGSDGWSQWECLTGKGQGKCVNSSADYTLTSADLIHYDTYIKVNPSKTLTIPIELMLLNRVYKVLANRNASSEYQYWNVKFTSTESTSTNVFFKRVQNSVNVNISFTISSTDGAIGTTQPLMICRTGEKEVYVIGY